MVISEKKYTLKDLHIGISKETGKSLFLACPVESKGKEYVDALKLHFGYDLSGERR